MDVVQQALAGGARLVQYRDSGVEGARRQAEALALRVLCSQHGVPLIIEGDVALASALAADGVHLGPQDDAGMARAMLGAESIIGVSCGDSLQRAQAAARAGASYLSFGVFFESSTKPGAPHAPFELLRQSAALGLPRVAIGGITPDNGAALVAAGADYLAAIGALFALGDVRAAAQRFTDLYPLTRASA